MKLIKREYVSIMYIYESEVDDSEIEEGDENLSADELWDKYNFEDYKDCIREKYYNEETEIEFPADE